MTFYKTAIAACAIGLSTSASMAETFSCMLHDARNSGWLPEQLVVEINSNETMGKTYDPITFSTLNGFAEVNGRSDRKQFGFIGQFQVVSADRADRLRIH